VLACFSRLIKSEGFLQCLWEQVAIAIEKTGVNSFDSKQLKIVNYDYNNQSKLKTDARLNF